ncbi:MAG: hypothetical protein M0Z66_15860 [Thermaerobacter sp.]|nr:hypothetical protein [Thermaerobacter sp.]
MQFGRQPALLGLDRTGAVVYSHSGSNPRDLPDIDAALDAVAPR